MQDQFVFEGRPECTAVLRAINSGPTLQSCPTKKRTRELITDVREEKEEEEERERQQRQSQHEHQATPRTTAAFPPSSTPDGSDKRKLGDPSQTTQKRRKPNLRDCGGTLPNGLRTMLEAVVERYSADSSRRAGPLSEEAAESMIRLVEVLHFRNVVKRNEWCVCHSS